MKLKIYILHSDKRKYKEEIYIPLLEKGLMNDFYLILPFSEKYKSVYVKELMLESDIIICDLTSFDFFARLELKFAKKSGKQIYYYIRSDDKRIKKYKFDNLVIYQSNVEFINLVCNLLNSLNKKSLLLKRDNIYNLGKIEKHD